jgi:hypothetical protein
MINFLSVIVRDLDAGRSRGGPGKADTPLVVDANAVLSRSIASELLETIARRHPQIVECLRSINDQQLSMRYPL